MPNVQASKSKGIAIDSTHMEFHEEKELNSISKESDAESGEKDISEVI